MFGWWKRKNETWNIQAACGCNVGCVRSNNEDNLYFNGTVLPSDNVGLRECLCVSGAVTGPVHFGVFDGMGGEAYGELAAHIAATQVKNLPAGADVETLVAALYRANEEICTLARRQGCGIIGTTAAVLTVEPGAAYVTNVGDSKVYRLRGGEMVQLSTDHTDQQFLEQHAIKGRKPRLTQHLGIEPAEMVIEPAIRKEALVPGDCFLICSDGLSDMLTEEEIAAIVTDEHSPEICVGSLIHAALRNGGKDNVTVIVLKVI